MERGCGVDGCVRFGRLMVVDFDDNSKGGRRWWLWAEASFAFRVQLTYFDSWDLSANIIRSFDPFHSFTRG